MSTATLSPKTSTIEQQARANQRAHDQHVHIFKTARAGFFTTKSKSDATERYTLVVGAANVVACSCKGYGYRKVCKHSEALYNRLAREGAKPTPQPVDDCVADLYNDCQCSRCRK